MATKSENIGIERAQFNHFRDHIQDLMGLDSHTIDVMLDKGMLQVSTAWEHALADLGGYQVVSEDTRDFNDACRSDAKLCTVRYSGKLSGYSAPVSNVHNKEGSLRCAVLEPSTGMMYYFHIPKSAYAHINSRTNIEIPFDHSGLPRRNNECKVNWWLYEEKTIRDCAVHMQDPVARQMARNLKMFRTLNHSGGKVSGQLSMTPNAVRKREARARLAG